jgi:PHP family Zn ribbon phosphoesterase
MNQTKKCRFVCADLHIHSALSPCADNNMLPQLVLEKAYNNGLNMIAITDHNSVLNVQAFIEAAANYKQGFIKVIPGIEVQCLEEVHIICLFENIEVTNKFNKHIQSKLPNFKNNSKVFGEQLVVDCRGRIMGSEERLLLNSVDLSVEEVVYLVNIYGGIAIAAHIDRPAYSLLSVLGFIPENINIDALELSWRADVKHFSNIPNLTDFSFISSSDAHYLEDIGRAFISFGGEGNFHSLRTALFNNKLQIKVKRR